MISIHAPREGSDIAMVAKAVATKMISIHAPREGSDPCLVLSRLPGAEFQSTLPVRGATSPPLPPPHPEVISIHAPREGSDLVDLRPAGGVIQFQSTLPVRGATPSSQSFSRFS